MAASKKNVSISDLQNAYLTGRRTAALGAEWAEDQIRDLGLSPDQLATQSEEDIRNSLERIDRLLQLDQSERPRVWIDLDSKTLTRPLGSPLPDGVVEFSITNDQLVASRLAAKDRQAELASERVEELTRVQGSASAEQRPDIDRELADLKQEQRSIDEQREGVRWQPSEISAEETLALQAQAAELERLAEREAAEIRNQWWKTRLGRDSIAAVVGGILLVCFSAAVIVAMFTDTDTTELVANSFLLILGFFFGAATPVRNGDTG